MNDKQQLPKQISCSKCGKESERLYQFGKCKECIAEECKTIRLNLHAVGVLY